ncbi:peptidoglycan DD-metalloendopeptidase family protein [Streptomyces sp. NPDC048297]|uniref:M23 family metallopeptidase n=1 Tax=Streptomyces sp. NPDC048297 TaxID=3365531 RepID=UPI0037225BD3
MNDRHPSGTMTTPGPASDASSAHYASYGAQEAPYDDLTTYGGYDAGGFAAGANGTGSFDTDPLFGGFPGDAQTTGSYDTTHWQTGTASSPSPSPAYDPYTAQHHAAYDSGTYDATGWTVPAQPTGNDVSGQWDTSAWLQPDQTAAVDPAQQQWYWDAQTGDTGAYDATQWNADGTAVEHEQLAEPFDPSATATFEQVGDPHATGAFEHAPYEHTPYEDTSHQDTPYDGVAYEDLAEPTLKPASEEDELGATGETLVVPELLEDQEEAAPVRPAGSRGAARSRRRTPAKRSALLTIAVPSACVMGVAGIAAASVGHLTDDGTDTTATAPDAHAVKPSVANSKLDTQLERVSAGADDFADRASRTQERIDLRTQQALEKKKAAAEAALKERLRPKFALPVMQRGLSAYFGQAGVNWMSVHTGIDFPVSYGTTVMSATDGVVSTKWNSAYGNMMIVTAKDGTETWYCHLSSYRVTAGTVVKAGEPVAYSGNSGNSTGPHLHFEVRPAGGAAVDPLPWLRSHGLDPT